MIEQQTDDDAGLVAMSAVIELRASGFCVRIVRADGVIIPFDCRSASAAAELIGELCPPEYFVSIPEGPARAAMLAALGDDGHSEAPRTLH